MLKSFFFYKGDFKVTGYYVTAVPDYSHLAYDFIKPCDCHMMPLSIGIWLHSWCVTAVGLNQTWTDNVLHMVVAYWSVNAHTRNQFQQLPNCSP